MRGEEGGYVAEVGALANRALVETRGRDLGAVGGQRVVYRMANVAKRSSGA